MLTDFIKGKTDKAPKAVRTPEWPDADGKMFVRRLEPVERRQFFDELFKNDANRPDLFQAFVVCRCACQADGKPAFESDAWQWLGSEAPSAIARIAGKADAINFLSRTSEDELEKKSETPSTGESTDNSLPASA